ncbi:hypothetical protein EVAR_44220_1 [Eumeta japonica]|uniref:Uncharacterized protein n=1 Tax=Eumeta variegata TaxID=151549 RepID=A0A4C1W2C1_EUMVA|nr:hypothetical protein EVAR_44220_1 [Eumeta japonica]
MDKSEVQSWRWLPSKENVADDATRDVPKSFAGKPYLVHGNRFLKENSNHWPQKDEKEILNLATDQKIELTMIKKVPKRHLEPVPGPNRLSRYNRMIRAAACFLQCVEMSKIHKSSTVSNNTKNKQMMELTSKYINDD